MTFLFSKPHPHPARSWPLILAVMRHTGSLGGLKAYSNEILVPFLPLLFPGFPLAIQPPWEEPWQHQPEANPIPKGDSAGTAAQILSPTCHRNNCCWTVKHWPFTISHLPACCQSSSEESVDHFSSPWHFVLSPEHVLHFQRKDLQGVVAPSCILLPAQAAYSAWENWFFFGFCLFADLRCLPNKHLHRKCSQYMHTFGNKGSPSNFGKKHPEMWLHLSLPSATRIWTHFLPAYIFFSKQWGKLEFIYVHNVFRMIPFSLCILNFVT